MKYKMTREDKLDILMDDICTIVYSLLFFGAPIGFFLAFSA